MTNPLEYIRLHPKLAKQIIGLTLPQLEQLIKKAISQRSAKRRAVNEQRKKEAEKDKIRLNKKGAGRAKNSHSALQFVVIKKYRSECTSYLPSATRNRSFLGDKILGFQVIFINR